MSVMDEWLLHALYGPETFVSYNVLEVELTFGTTGHTEIVVLVMN